MPPGACPPAPSDDCLAAASINPQTYRGSWPSSSRLTCAHNNNRVPAKLWQVLRDRSRTGSPLGLAGRSVRRRAGSVCHAVLDAIRDDTMCTSLALWPIGTGRLARTLAASDQSKRATVSSVANHRRFEPLLPRGCDDHTRILGAAFDPATHFQHCSLLKLLAFSR